MTTDAQKSRITNASGETLVQVAKRLYASRGFMVVAAYRKMTIGQIVDNNVWENHKDSLSPYRWQVIGESTRSEFHNGCSEISADSPIFSNIPDPDTSAHHFFYRIVALD